MKTAFFTILVSFHIMAVPAVAQKYETLHDCRLYFEQNADKLDSIEGLWSYTIRYSVYTSSPGEKENEGKSIVMGGSDMLVIFADSSGFNAYTLFLDILFNQDYLFSSMIFRKQDNSRDYDYIITKKNHTLRGIARMTDSNHLNFSFSYAETIGSGDFTFVSREVYDYYLSRIPLKDDDGN